MSDRYAMLLRDGGCTHLGAIGHAIDHSTAKLGDEAELQTVRDCYASLSRREREVIALVVAGRLNKQVGGDLGISGADT